MQEYHKIHTIFKRDPLTKFKTLLEGEYSLPEFEYLANNEWTFTEKVDGTNIRIMWNGEKITFGGRTDKAQIPAELTNWLKESFYAGNPLESYNSDNVCLYGEGYGSGIQKIGKCYSDYQTFVLFDVKIGNWWLKRKDVEEVAEQLCLDVVPVIGRGTLHNAIQKAKDGFLSWRGGCQAEGIVARPKVELLTSAGHRIITKVKCRDFK